MSCPLSESPKILIFKKLLMGRYECSRAATMEPRTPSMVRRNKNAASRPPFKGDGAAAMDHSKSSPLASTGVGSQTQSSPSFDLLTITDCSTNRSRARLNALRLA